MNNLPKVAAQQRRYRDSNLGPYDRKSDALPLGHRVTFLLLFNSEKNANFCLQTGYGIRKTVLHSAVPTKNIYIELFVLLPMPLYLQAHIFRN